MAAHAWTAFTFFWNKPGLTGVFTSAIIPTRICVLVSPTSEPGATGPEADALAELELLGDELPDELLDELLDDEQAASSAIAASTLAATPRPRYRRGRPVDGRPPVPGAAPRIREFDSLFHFPMLHPHN